MRKNKPEPLDDKPVAEATAADWESLNFDLCARLPSVARAIKQIADARGTSFEAVQWETIALGYRKYGILMPPELREHIAKHAPAALKPDLH
jgi:hypothetical protein